jgi:multiple sugar transport system ATP-binding protein
VAELRLDNISKRFGSTAALNDTSWHADDGSLVVVLGPTASGKTTSLRIIAGLEAADAGRVFLGGQEITRETPARRDVAVVFQNFSLYPHLSVAQNLSFPLRAAWRRLSENEIQERVLRAAKTLHIEALLERRPSLLSGGQMQRVAIGRALVRRPRLYLMDEPLTNLDAKLREELRFELKAIQLELHTTTIYVTHDPIEAMSLADKIVVLDSGRVLQRDTPENVYGRPAHRRVGELLGTPAMNFFHARIDDGSVILSDAPQFKWPLAELKCSSPTQALQIGIRPESIQIRQDGDVEAKCELVDFLGADLLLVLSVGGASLRAVVPEHTEIRAGDSCRIRIEPAAVHVFAADGQRIN